MSNRMTVKQYQEAARAAVRGTKPAPKPVELVQPVRDEAARAEAAAETRRKHLDECYGPPHEWEFVRKGKDPIGKHTKSGYLVKSYVIMVCHAHPDEGEVVAGAGEAETYGGLVTRRERPGRPPRRNADFDKHFASGVAR